MGGFCHYSVACPRCGAVGKFLEYGDYERNHVSYAGGRVLDSRVRPCRIKCLSCLKTHALLPDTITPYSPYSLCFKLIVLIAYLERDVPVTAICDSFGIAVSTLYEWKKIMLAQKDIMLGVLISRKTSALSFLKDMLNSGDISGIIAEFFKQFNFSFMQVASVTVAKSMNTPSPI